MVINYTIHCLGLQPSAATNMKYSANIGLRALIKVHELSPEKLSAYHIGFVIGPCFNATGRLDTASRALELLECKNEREAVFLAAELKSLNESRKDAITWTNVAEIAFGKSYVAGLHFDGTVSYTGGSGGSKGSFL